MALTGSPCYNAPMYDQIALRMEKLEDELDRLEHPLSEEIFWLLGIATALLAVAELSAAPMDELHTDLGEFDS